MDTQAVSDNPAPVARELGQKAWRAMTLNVKATPIERRREGDGALSVHGEDLGSGRYRVTVLRDCVSDGDAAALKFDIDVPSDVVRFNGCQSGLAEFERLLTEACKAVRQLTFDKGD